MKDPVASICRGISYAIGIIGVLVGIISWVGAGEFWAGLLSFVSILAGSLVLLMIFIGISSILDNQCELYEQNQRIERKLKEQFPDAAEKNRPAQAESPSYFTRQQIAASGVGKNGWMCPECGTANQESSRSCTGCGRYR